MRVNELRLAVLDLRAKIILPQSAGRELWEVKLLAHTDCPLFQAQVAPLSQDDWVLEVVDLLPGKHSLSASILKWA